MAAAHVQTLSEIRAMLESAGVRPRKRWGQHFLIDGNLMRRLFESAEVGAADTVLEVGAGTGGLTDLLVAAAGHVVVVEIDPVLFRLLEVRYAGRGNVMLIHSDVLDGKHQIAAPVGTALARYRPGANGRYSLVANLPYNAATPLVMNLVDWTVPEEAALDAGRDAREGGCEKGFSHERISGCEKGLSHQRDSHERGCERGFAHQRGGASPPRLAAPLQIQRMCFTVQKEVADRMEAAPGSGDYGPISIVLQATCALKRVALVPASAFWPRPQVASAMLRIDRTGNPFGDLVRLHRFVDFVRTCFGHRRKTLRYVLARMLGEQATAALADAVDMRRRPETLAVAEWIALWRAAEPLAEKHRE